MAQVNLLMIVESSGGGSGCGGEGLTGCYLAVVVVDVGRSTRVE